jgi:hypothetical protein
MRGRQAVADCRCRRSRVLRGFTTGWRWLFGLFSSPQNETELYFIKRNVKRGSMSLSAEPPKPSSSSAASDAVASLWERTLQEARSVSVCTAIALVLQLLLNLLTQVASYREECASDIDKCVSQIPRVIYLPFSLVAKWIVNALPSKIASQSAPGLIYASPWYASVKHCPFTSLRYLPTYSSLLSLGFSYSFKSTLDPFLIFPFEYAKQSWGD